MNTKQKIFKTIAAVGMILVFTGCSVAPAAAPQPTAAPTMDLVLLHTQVAQTVVANMTVEAALHPSATSMPTATQLPTATSIPTLQAPTLPPVATAKPASSGSGWTVYPTATKTPYTDSCTLQSTSPADYTNLDAGVDFDAKWTIKNTGKRNWNTQFYFKKVRGDLGPEGNIFLANEVAQTDSYTLTLDMNAPTDPGNYNGTYALVNDDGVSFCQFFVAIRVK